MKTQQKINQIQSVYQNWLISKNNLELALIELKKSNAMIAQLEQFYFNGEWRDIYEELENGTKFDFTTAGEYSIMSEDTLWNAFAEQQTLLWDFLRTATKALDKDKPEFYADLKGD